MMSVGSLYRSAHFTGLYRVTPENRALFSVLVCAEFVEDSGHMARSGVQFCT
jgi:hypothetical protein